MCDSKRKTALAILGLENIYMPILKNDSKMFCWEGPERESTTLKSNNDDDVSRHMQGLLWAKALGRLLFALTDRNLTAPQEVQTVNTFYRWGVQRQRS